MSPSPPPRRLSRATASTQASLTPQRKHRKLLKDGTSEVWPEDVEAVFVQGLRAFWQSEYAVVQSAQAQGRCRWRNSYLVDYLQGRNISRTKKQVASHVQVLRNMWKGTPEYSLVGGGEELFLDTALLAPKIEETAHRFPKFESDDDAPSPLTPLSAGYSLPDYCSPGKLPIETPYADEGGYPHDDHYGSPIHELQLEEMEGYIQDGLLPATPLPVLPSRVKVPPFIQPTEFAYQLQPRETVTTHVERRFTLGTPTQDSPRRRPQRDSLQLDLEMMSFESLGATTSLPSSPSSPMRRVAPGSPLRRSDPPSPWHGPSKRTSHKPCFGTASYPSCLVVPVQPIAVTMLQLWTGGMEHRSKFLIQDLVAVTNPVVREFPNPAPAPHELRLKLQFLPDLEPNTEPALQGFHGTVTLVAPWTVSAECVTKLWVDGECLMDETAALQPYPIHPSLLFLAGPASGENVYYLPDSAMSKCKYMNPHILTFITQDIIVDGRPSLNLCFMLEPSAIPGVAFQSFKRFDVTRELTPPPVQPPHPLDATGPVPQFESLSSWNLEDYNTQCQQPVPARSYLGAGNCLEATPRACRATKEAGGLAGAFTPQAGGRRRAQTSFTLHQ